MRSLMPFQACCDRSDQLHRVGVAGFEFGHRGLDRRGDGCDVALACLEGVRRGVGRVPRQAEPRDELVDARLVGQRLGDGVDRSRQQRADRTVQSLRVTGHYLPPAERSGFRAGCLAAQQLPRGGRVHQPGNGHHQCSGWCAGALAARGDWRLLLLTSILLA